MHIDENPLFREAIAPWYDIEAACLVTIILMEAVFIFGAAGVRVCRETPGFQRYLWVPALLMALSAVVILSITIRLARRYARTRKNRQSRGDGAAAAKR